MRRRLFLTGEMEVGKSTAILEALGERLPRLGGFLTRRELDEAGHARSFYLETPEGSQRGTFLDFSSGRPLVDLSVFETLGVAALQGEVLVLDEIGGIELTCPAFSRALRDVLNSGVPILGVVKGKAPASALIKALGLGEAYRREAAALWDRLSRDGNTLIYECSRFDETARKLAGQWVEEYGP